MMTNLFWTAAKLGLGVRNRVTTPQTRNTIQAGSFGLAIEASRSVFDVAFPLFAVQVLRLPNRWSTLFFSAMHCGAVAGMVAFSQDKLAGWVESLSSLAFFIMAMSYFTLAHSPPSFALFLLVAAMIGLATSVASVSSSVLIQLSSRDKPECSHLNAVYRVVGILTRIAFPLLIGKILDAGNEVNSPEHAAQSRHAVLMTALGTGLSFMAANLWLFRATPSQHRDGHDTERQTLDRTQLSDIDPEKWSQIFTYCVCVSLPNMAGGLIRSLLAPFLMQTLDAGPTFFSTTHAVAQFVSVFLIIVVSRVLRHGRSSSLLRFMVMQSFLMALAAVVLGSSTTHVSAAMAFVLMRSIEESCKLPNSLMLNELCTHTGSPPTATRASNPTLLAKAIALQKGIGSVLKVSASLLSSVSVAWLGVTTTIHIGAGICMLGSAALAWTYHRSHLTKLE